MNIKMLAAIEAVVIIFLLVYIYLAPQPQTLVKIERPISASQNIVLNAKQRWKKQHEKTQISTLKPEKTTRQPNNKLASSKSEDAAKRFTHLLDKLIENQNTQDINRLIDENSNELFNLIITHPELMNQVLEKYENTYDSNVEEFLAQVLLASENMDIEQTATQKLSETSGDESRKWLKILSYTGATNQESRQAVRKQMQILNEPKNIDLAIRSLAPINAYSDERKGVVGQLKGYLEHPNKSVQVQALKALIHWSVDEREKLIVNALQSSSQKMKNAAILGAYEAGFQSDKIKPLLLDMMNDKNQTSQDRFLAATILENYSLSSTQRDSVVQFLKNIEIPEVNLELD